jgi:transcriptional regulator with XRE-family HTH domain
MAAAYFDYTDTAARLRTQREAKQITQENMARLLDMSFTMYRNIETGKRPLTVPTLLKLCNILDIEASQLAPGLAGKYHIQQDHVQQDGNTLHDTSNANNGVVVYEQSFEAERRIWEKLENANKEIIATKDEIIAAKDEIIEALKLALSK